MSTPVSYQSAIVIIPPEDLWKADGKIQNIRKRYDKSFERWMPHINLVFGFLPEAMFEEAAPKLSKAVESLSPFTITFSDFDYFDHGRSNTVYLKPTVDGTPIHTLQQKLEAVYPWCNEQSSKSAAGFTPHLTVGQLQKSELQRTINNWGKDWQPISFTVNQVYVISRSGNSPFAVRKIIPLGKTNNNNTQAISAIPQRSPGLSLFVGNLPLNVDPSALRSLFETSGIQPINISVPQGKQFGFVEVANENDRQNAIKSVDGVDFGGKRLCVQMAK